MNKEGEKIHHLPPVWCSAICRNAMSEICVEHCAIKRDCSGFDPKPNLKLEDMPRYPLKESASMTREEKFASVVVYLAKVVDRLQGFDDEQIQLAFHKTSRPVTVYERNAVLGVAANIQGSNSKPAGPEADIKPRPFSEATSNPLPGFESIPRKDDK